MPVSKIMAIDKLNKILRSNDGIKFDMATTMRSDSPLRQPYAAEFVLDNGY